MCVWVILYTYSGYDGEIYRLIEDFDATEDGDFLSFSTEKKAKDYLISHNQLDNSNNEYTIHKVVVR